MSAGTELERIADAITLLKRGPHTAREIAARLEVQPAAVRRWCGTLVDKGHARRGASKRVRGNETQTWEWV